MGRYVLLALRARNHPHRNLRIQTLNEQIEALPPSETGIRLQPRMLVVLMADELAAALHKACGMDEKKMAIPKFAQNTAEAVLKLLPPLYYEPRSDK